MMRKPILLIMMVLLLFGSAWAAIDQWAGQDISGMDQLAGQALSGLDQWSGQDLMAGFEHIVDYYDESNLNVAYSMYNGGQIGRGQSFTGDGSNLTKARFYICKVGNPTGNAVAKLYAHTGTFGVNSSPTGAALATSDNLDVSTLPVSLSLTDLQFSIPYALANGTNYIVTLEFSGGDASNYIDVGHDNSTPTHVGNRCYTADGISWNASSSVDLIFYVYGG